MFHEKSELDVTGRVAQESSFNSMQRKSYEIAPGLVNFAIGLVIFVLNLPDGQVLFLGEIQITEGL